MLVSINRYLVGLLHTCPQYGRSVCDVYFKEFDAGNMTSYEIGNLQPFTEYMVNISVLNQIGRVKSPSVKFITKGEGKFCMSTFRVFVFVSR